MLKYSIKCNKSNSELIEIPYDSLFFSNDLSYISGVTSSNFKLDDGQYIYLQFNESKKYNRYKIEVRDVIRRGYINSGLNAIFKDENNFYFFKLNNGIELVNHKSNKYRYWCDDNKIIYNNNEYIVDFNIEPKINIGNNSVTLTDTDNIQHIQHFIIKKDDDIPLNIDGIKCVKKYDNQWKNVEYSDKLNIYIKDNILINQGDIINVIPIESYIECCEIFNDNGKNKISLYGKTYEISTNTIDYIVIGDKEYELTYVSDIMLVILKMVSII